MMILSLGPRYSADLVVQHIESHHVCINLDGVNLFGCSIYSDRYFLSHTYRLVHLQVLRGSELPSQEQLLSTG